MTSPAPFRPTPSASPALPGPRRLAAALLLGLLGAALLATPAFALKVASWNIVSYGSTNISFRQAALRTVISAMDPDVIAIVEMNDAAARDSFLTNVLNVAEPGQWAGTAWFPTCYAAVFYKPAKVTMTFSGAPISTGGPRDVLGVRYRVAGYTSKGAETRMYVVHFKAGTTDSATRRVECTALRNSMNGINPALVTTNFLLCGDTNFYGSWEGGYIRLTEAGATELGRNYDPLSMPGTWNSNYAYRYYHTQSTCLSGCAAGYYSAGGLDDRFDLFLTSNTLQDATGMDLMLGSYTPYGNDGQHYNQSVNAGGYNYVVSMDVANALFTSSDHLPVMITLKAPAKVSAESQLDFGRVIVGGTAEQALHVANVAADPAAGLNYSLAAPAGFTAPAGSFLVYTGAGSNTHTISLYTGSPAGRSDTLRVNSDDPDSTAKAVLVAGTILNHAVASLDSTSVVTSAHVEFGVHGAGEFEDQPVRVHDAGWYALQSRLRITGGTITGGGGHFSIVGGFSPAEAGQVGQTYSVRFDPAGATPDSNYEATLTLTTADEDVPGGTAQSGLVVTLGARLYSGNAGATGQLPDRVAFLPPSPNPFRGSTTLRFELPQETAVAMDLFDLSGRLVAPILHGTRPAGRHTLQWSAAGSGGGPLRTGLYFVRFEAGGFRCTRRLALVR
jgi:endonuclease/exonuclease/phosphatase family metal-dependent hydrolase